MVRVHNSWVVNSLTLEGACSNQVRVVTNPECSTFFCLLDWFVFRVFSSFRHNHRCKWMFPPPHFDLHLRWNKATYHVSSHLFIQLTLRVSTDSVAEGLRPQLIEEWERFTVEGACSNQARVILQIVSTFFPSCSDCLAFIWFILSLRTQFETMRLIILFYWYSPEVIVIVAFSLNYIRRPRRVQPAAHKLMVIYSTQIQAVYRLGGRWSASTTYRSGC
jgi:hypothetical protein